MSLEINVRKFLDIHNVILMPGEEGKPDSKIPIREHMSNDPNVIINWIKKGCAIFMPTGEINGIVAIDCDDAVGRTKFLAYTQRHGVGYSTIYQSTPSAGSHFFYRYDSRLGNEMKLDGHKPCHIDIRNNGHCVKVRPEHAEFQSGSQIDTRKPETLDYRMTGPLTDVPEFPPCLLRDLMESQYVL